MLVLFVCLLQASSVTLLLADPTAGNSGNQTTTVFQQFKATLNILDTHIEWIGWGKKPCLSSLIDQFKPERIVTRITAEITFFSRSPISGNDTAPDHKPFVQHLNINKKQISFDIYYDYGKPLTRYVSKSGKVTNPIKIEAIIGCLQSYGALHLEDGKVYTSLNNVKFISPKIEVTHER
ncbi:MAG: hypothetical protein HQM10_09865 [Candidatus Riflebacteria bacterium]|nr:hypothetical protein [Candidatus Riflebacteria bacterium]